MWTGLHSSLASPLPHLLTDWLLWLAGPLLPSSQVREAARTVVWLARGGAASSQSGLTWHSCEAETPRDTEEDTDLAHLQSLSDLLIQGALSS